jgi:ferric-dicitrate binding protein FerR (iron transport regulator)
MTFTQQHDRLFHVLLEEAVGNHAPPDLAERVVERLSAGPRRRRRWMVPVTAAAAIILAGGLWVAQGLWGYPSPAVSGDYRIETGSLA